MEQFDGETVRKIWQRVQSGNASHQPAAQPPQKVEQCSLSQWIGRELAAAELYLRLSKVMPGKTGNTLRQFAQQEQAHAAALKGICTVAEGTCPDIRPMPAQKAPVSVLLRQCYGQKLVVLAEYEKRTSDLQYGKVFQRLAQQEQAQCQFLLELIGSFRQTTHNKRGLYYK